MSGIGFWELIILFLIGLIVLGPERLPRVANQLGTWLGQARRMTRVMRRQLEEEINFEKELSIKPDKDKKKPSYEAPEYVSRNEDDDTYSPAHDRDSVGTGVGDEDEDEFVIDPEDLAETDVLTPEAVAAAAKDTQVDGSAPAEPVKEKTA